MGSKTIDSSSSTPTALAPENQRISTKDLKRGIFISASLNGNLCPEFLHPSTFQGRWCRRKQAKNNQCSLPLVIFWVPLISENTSKIIQNPHIQWMAYTYVQYSLLFGGYISGLVSAFFHGRTCGIVIPKFNVNGTLWGFPEMGVPPEIIHLKWSYIMDLIYDVPSETIQLRVPPCMETTI